MKQFRLSLLALLALFPACTLAPSFERPANPVAANWPNGEAYKESSTATDVSNISWQAFVIDQKLRSVIELALTNNRDLRIATLNVERARAMYGIQRSELFPALDTSAYGGRQRIPARLTEDGNSKTSEQYNANIGIASWEIDFFGYKQSLSERAYEEYLATEQAQRGARVLLISSVAGAYLTLAADKENLELAKSTLEAQQKSYDLIERRYKVGLVSDLVLAQARTSLETAKVNISLYTRVVAQDENALTLLVGVPLPAELIPTELTTISTAQEISAGLSSEVLLLRPDIMQAESILKAANANLGAARAAFFPRISLTTAIGTGSTELSGLFKSDSDVWNFTPRIVLPIFDARLWSAADAVAAEREIAIAQYEKAIQAAFREVSDTLAVSGTVNEQLAAQQSLVDTTARTYYLADARYNKGLDSYLTVLDAHRSLFAAKQGLIAVKLLKFTNQMRLYAVLGGGAS